VSTPAPADEERRPAAVATVGSLGRDRDQSSLKVLIGDLAAQHEELDRLLADISSRLDDADGRRAVAFAALRDLLEPHLAAEEEHTSCPVAPAAIAARPGGPPPRPAERDEEAVPDRYGVPFAVEHPDEELRSVAPPLFPTAPDPSEVERRLVDYRGRVGRWAA
jgi:hypothetical protein